MASTPLAGRMRPRSLDEVVGQRHLLGPGRPLTALVESAQVPSVILWGPAGSGKTTIAHLLGRAAGGELVQLSAVASGVADARKVMQRAKDSMLPTVLFVDEVHRWSKSQQDVLLPTVEDGTIRLIGATTENPYFSLVSPLLSRCLLLRLEQLEPSDIRALMDRALADPERGLGDLGIEVDEDALAHLAEVSGGDARIALTGLETAVLAAKAKGEARVDRALAEESIQKKAIVYDRQGDAHYDVISAFIKSIRGSDPDAALFWLARMLEAGEDARYIARRMVVHASEDVGLADPRALMVAVAAAQAVEYVGLPECRLNLAEAAIYLARAPKSNSVTTALGKASEEAASADPVPLHLREPGHPALRRHGYGQGYKYPHDYPEHVVEQDYRPVRFQGSRYYEPSGMGEEAGDSLGQGSEGPGYDSGREGSGTSRRRESE